MQLYTLPDSVLNAAMTAAVHSVTGGRRLDTSEPD